MKTKKQKLRFISVFIFLFSLSCAPDLGIHRYEDDDFETIDNIYHIRSSEIENTCAPEGDREIFGGTLWMYVTVQGYIEDGGYIADIEFSTLLWENVNILPDGTFDAEFNYFDVETDSISGILTPESFNANFTTELIDLCHLSYFVDGFPMFVPQRPPEGWRNE